MLDNDCLVFVEVRFRRNARYGGAAASIDQRKQKKLRATAEHYLQRAGQQQTSRACRFDVVLLENPPAAPCKWIRNAF